MQMQEELNQKILAAKLENEKLTAEKQKYELEKLKKSLDIPFYRSPDFFRPLAAGVSLAMILAAYIQYIFLPTQNKFNLEIENAEFIIQQNTARHAAQLAKLELLKDQIEHDAKLSNTQLQQANTQLEQAKKQNLKLQDQIAAMIKQQQENPELTALQDEIKQNAQAINQQLAQIQDVEVSVDNLKTFAITDEVKTGWIYIGYFPNETWEYKNIDISQGKPAKGQLYTLTRNLNVRSHAPELSWFHYQYGAVSGYLTAGQKVKILDSINVGISKVWAKIETVPNTNKL